MSKTAPELPKSSELENPRLVSSHLNCSGIGCALLIFLDQVGNGCQTSGPEHIGNPSLLGSGMQGADGSAMVDESKLKELSAQSGCNDSWTQKPVAVAKVFQTSTFASQI